MLQAGKIYEIEASDLTLEGKGVGRADGVAVFVPDLLPGERGKIRIERTAKNYAEGALVERLCRSENRVLPVCPHFGECGGCQLQHSNYIGQLVYKNHRVENCMRKIAKIPEDAEIRFPLPAREHFAYRNKAALPIIQGKNGIEIGYYKKKSHALIEIQKCPLLPWEMNAAIGIVRNWANAFGIPAYEEKTGKGLLRHLILRCSHAGEMMVAIAACSDELLHTKELIRSLRIELPEVYSVLLNINKRRTSQILGDTTKVLFGSPSILEELGGLFYDISLQTFLQINHEQAELLYQTAFKLARILPGEVVVDLYCGAGIMALYAAKLGGKAYGIEIVQQAIWNAKQNAKRNGLENAEFLCADCADGFWQVSQKAGKIDVVIVDPPRRGLEKKVVEDIAKSRPGRVVYVSCDPATLARDLLLFSEHGYLARFVQPVDLFPQTTHIETVVLLSKLNTKQHIEVELNLDELDLTAAESKATYEEIKEYVLEHTGLKVSHLYIAQVKQKYGIIERENYNKPKSENSRQPKCPPEKEAAITEALKHFGMI